MRTGSSFCWQLIHSMSGPEKIFFKRNFTGGRDKSSQLYLRLFDALARQSEYDEAALLKKFQRELTKKTFASLKHYLQQQICKAIIEYDNMRHHKSDLYKQVQLIRALRRKGLMEESLGVWKKAVISARSQESYNKLGLLKGEFEKMILLSGMQTPYDILHATFLNHRIGYDEYADLNTLRDMYTELLLLKRKSHYDIAPENLDRIYHLEYRLTLVRPPSGKSFWYRHYHQMCHATIYYLLNRLPEAFDILQEQWNWWKKSRSFIENEGEFYIELLYMINYVGVGRGEYDYVQQVIDDPVNNLIKDPVYRANYEAIRFLALNRIYNKTAQYGKVEKLLTEIKTRYNRWEPILNPDLNRTINMSVGISSFVLEHFGDALYYLKKGLNEYKDGTREEHQAVGQVLLLLTTYCMNNARLFDAQYRTTYQYFYKRKKKRPFETALVQCLHRTFYMNDLKNKRAIYQEALELFDKHKDDPVQQLTFSIFNYPGWLESRVQRIPYRQYVEKKVLSGKVGPPVSASTTLLSD